VLSLKYSFHDENSLFLVFDMCSGGDLKFHLRQTKARNFSLERARFYAAEVFLGLEHMHSFDIVYRDLKPNNILLMTNGHIMISDLGLTVKLRKDKVRTALLRMALLLFVNCICRSTTTTSVWYWYSGTKGLDN
jgi:serine/threonine protein kinase